MSRVDEALVIFYSAHELHRRATEAYSARLEVARSGGWSIPIWEEHSAMHDTQALAVAASEALYRAMREEAGT